MKLDFSQIKSITKGAVRVEEEKDGITFYRFTKEQEDWYKETDDGFYRTTMATAGVKLTFKTDSKKLYMKLLVTEFVNRKFFSMDVYVDGKVIGYIDNFSDKPLPKEYTQGMYPQGIFEKEFVLGNGEKTVCIHMPYSAKAQIAEMSVDDCAYIEPVEEQEKLLAFGDSITQGFDALRPSARYISRLAEGLGLEEVNKGVGGEGFCPKLATFKEDFCPKLITVAYGTNDWSHLSREEFVKRCRAFYENISRSYPEVDIYAFSPIWRKDYDADKSFGLFSDVEKEIAEAVKNLKNVTFISGFDFVPQDENCFGDFRLHPNDKGFEYHFKGLITKMEQCITKNQR